MLTDSATEVVNRLSYGGCNWIPLWRLLTDWATEVVTSFLAEVVTRFGSRLEVTSLGGFYHTKFKIEGYQTQLWIGGYQTWLRIRDYQTWLRIRDYQTWLRTRDYQTWLILMM